MSARLKLALAACLTGLLGGAVSARSAEPSRVCLQAKDPPLSLRGDGTGSGFDVALSERIAQRLGRPLAMQWFTTRRDPDSDPALEDNALLSDGRCELLPGYALIADALGKPRADKARLPPFVGAAPDDRRRWVRLGELVPTRAYRFDALTVILSPAQAERAVHTLADLAGLKIGVEIHSVTDLIAMGYTRAKLADNVVHYPDAYALFQDLESGHVDAALVGLHQFDAWRHDHPKTAMGASGYTHSIGFNIGFVSLASAGGLIARVNAALAELMSDGSLAAIARKAGLTYLPPRVPEIAPPVPLAALEGD